MIFRILDVKSPLIIFALSLKLSWTGPVATQATSIDCKPKVVASLVHVYWSLAKPGLAWSCSLRRACRQCSLLCLSSIQAWLARSKAILRELGYVSLSELDDFRHITWPSESNSLYVAPQWMPSRSMRVINALSLTYQPGPRGPNEIIFSIYTVVINTSIHSCCLNTSGSNYYILHIFVPLGLHRNGRQRLGSHCLLRLQGQSHRPLGPRLQHIGYRLGNKERIGWKVRNRCFPALSMSGMTPISKD